jgi:MFS family permease
MGWAFLVTKMPQYLEDVHQSGQQDQGWLQSLPLLAGIAGLLLGGLFTDRLTRRLGLRWGRSIAMSVSRLIVALAFLGCLTVDSPLKATLFLALVGLATDLGTPACWAYGQDIGGSHVGSVVGWSNMWGNFGAALSPVILGWIVAQFTSVAAGWHGAFASCAALNILAAVAALGINASRPLRRG